MLEQSILWPAHGAEEWRAVPGHEGRYEVSDLGRVRSLRQRCNTYDRLRAEPLVLRLAATHGYLHVKLGGRDGSGRRVHRLVLEAFVGPCPPECEASHLNGKRDDNRLENLRWVTHLENIRHRDIHGTTARGERHGTRTHPERVARGERNGSHGRHDGQGEANSGSKLTAARVTEIRAAAQQGVTRRALAALYGVHHTTINAIVHRRKWAHVP